MPRSKSEAEALDAPARAPAGDAGRGRARSPTRRRGDAAPPPAGWDVPRPRRRGERRARGAALAARVAARRAAARAARAARRARPPAARLRPRGARLRSSSSSWAGAARRRPRRRGHPDQLRHAARRGVDRLVRAARDELARAPRRLVRRPRTACRARGSRSGCGPAGGSRDDARPLDQRAADLPALRVARGDVAAARAASRGDASVKPSGASHVVVQRRRTGRSARASSRRSPASPPRRRARRRTRPRRGRGSAACRRGSARCPSAGS